MSKTRKAAEAEARAVMKSLRAQQGMLSRIAREIGVYAQAVHQWQMVPLDRVVDVERITGIAREKLRPDYHLPRSADCPVPEQRMAV